MDTLSFSEPALEDRAWAAPLLRREGLALCDYSFPVLWCWREVYGFRLARLGDRLLISLRYPPGTAYLWPAGEGDPRPALAALRQDAARRGEPLRLMGLTEAHCRWLEATFPGRFSFWDLRAGANYLYDLDRLADLPGKHLHAKRNHIHRFETACPGYTCAPLTDGDRADCLALNAAWYEEALRRTDGDPTLRGESEALAEALRHREALGLEGIVLRHEGRLLAFSLGALLTDTVFDVHFERAGEDVPGAYAAVNRAFAQAVRENHPGVRYLNREEDMGLAGLRQAKLSYHPDRLLVYKCAADAAAE